MGGSRFLQVYRGFKSLWSPISNSAGQLDNRLKRIIGALILVAFSRYHGKELA